MASVVRGRRATSCAATRAPVSTGFMCIARLPSRSAGPRAEAGLWRAHFGLTVGF